MNDALLRAINDRVNNSLLLALVLNASIFYVLFTALTLFVPVPLMTLLFLLNSENYGWAFAWVLWNCWSWLVMVVFLKSFEL